MRRLWKEGTGSEVGTTRGRRGGDNSSATGREQQNRFVKLSSTAEGKGELAQQLRFENVSNFSAQAIPTLVAIENAAFSIHRVDDARHVPVLAAGLGVRTAPPRGGADRRGTTRS